MKMRKYISLYAVITLCLITLAGCRRDVIEPGYGNDWKERIAAEIDTGLSRWNGYLDGGEQAVQQEQVRIAEGELEVHFIDVGQGDATFIRCGEQSMLIDAGENNQGEKVVAYLQEQGVEKLDYVIGTHPHSDHIGGLDTVILAIDTETVILPDKIHTSRTFEDVLLAVEERGLEVTLPVPGDIYELGEAAFTVIAPVEEYGNNLNNWSVGIRLLHGGNSFVFTGDAEEKAERDILGNGTELKAEVLKLGHHGSATSTLQEFLDEVQPEYVVISCGRDNKYGHPHQTTMDKLKAAGSEIYRTDEMGTITVISDGVSLVWSHEPSETFAPGSGEEIYKE